MNIHVTNDTNGFVDIGNVYDETCTAMRQLFTNDEQTAITVYVVITSKRIPSNCVGVCRHMSDDVYMVYMKHWSVNTLRHELYHVYQFNDGLPLCERTATQFANLLSTSPSLTP